MLVDNYQVQFLMFEHRYQLSSVAKLEVIFESTWCLTPQPNQELLETARSVLTGHSRGLHSLSLLAKLSSSKIGRNFSRAIEEPWNFALGFVFTWSRCCVHDFLPFFSREATAILGVYHWRCFNNDLVFVNSEHCANFVSCNRSERLRWSRKNSLTVGFRMQAVRAVPSRACCMDAQNLKELVFTRCSRKSNEYYSKILVRMK